MPGKMLMDSESDNYGSVITPPGPGRADGAASNLKLEGTLKIRVPSNLKLVTAGGSTSESVT
jgi:hypothetical protein